MKNPGFRAQTPAAHLLHCFDRGRPATGIVRGRRLAALEVSQPNLNSQGAEVMALVPPSTLVGDRICVFRSCPVPFVLRKIFPDGAKELDTRVRNMAHHTATEPLRRKTMSSFSTPGEYYEGERWDVAHYNLVGECFVEGLMYGLAQNAPDNRAYGRARLVVLH